MKGTAVQGFSKLAAKIHPVSLSKQESSRLLTALTTSFEKHLDAAHPVPHHHDQRKQSTNGRGRPTSIQDRPSTLTESFFASVLTNPIIAPRAEDSISDKLSRTKSLQQDPMRVFAEQAAAGTATPEVALLCLQTYTEALYKIPQKERQSKIIAIQAGFNVLRWLWSSHYQDSDIFLRDKRLVNIMAEFLVAEGREETIWKWFERTEPRVLVEGQYISPKAQILRALVRAHMIAGFNTGIEAALRSFFRASERYRTEDFPGLAKYRLLRSAGLYLTRALQSSSLSVESRPALLLLYDRFLQSSSSWAGPNSRPITLDVMVLKLRHPVFPDASDALAFVRSLRETPDHEFFSPSLRSKLLSTLFETVEVLQTKNLHDDAAWVMEFMRQNFADDLEHGQKQYSNSKQASADTDITCGPRSAVLKTISAEPAGTHLAERALRSLSWRTVPG